MTDRPKIYVVTGTTGEWSDRDEWPVAAYLSEERAREHAEKADHKAKELFVVWGENRWDMPDGANPFDPHMSMDYTGTDYGVMTVPLMDGPEITEDTP